jgi:hypothetical protein
VIVSAARCTGPSHLRIAHIQSQPQPRDRCFPWVTRSALPLSVAKLRCRAAVMLQPAPPSSCLDAVCDVIIALNIPGLIKPREVSGTLLLIRWGRLGNHGALHVAGRTMACVWTTPALSEARRLCMVRLFQIDSGVDDWNLRQECSPGNNNERAL